MKPSSAVAASLISGRLQTTCSSEGPYRPGRLRPGPPGNSCGLVGFPGNGSPSPGGGDEVGQAGSLDGGEAMRATAHPTGPAVTASVTGSGGAQERPSVQTSCSDSDVPRPREPGALSLATHLLWPSWAGLLRSRWGLHLPLEVDACVRVQGGKPVRGPEPWEGYQAP